LVNYVSIPYTTLNFRISPNITLNSSGVMQESSPGFAASPNQSEQIVQEAVQLWKSEKQLEQIV
jgi:hypothetical protein